MIENMLYYALEMQEVGLQLYIEQYYVDPSSLLVVRISIEQLFEES